MHIDPDNFKENQFKGRMHVENLQQFFKMFFPHLAERLNLITPPCVREQPFVNSYLDLTYEPGHVAINGIDLTGAFSFDGLIDFHGLLSTARVVMDPD